MALRNKWSYSDSKIKEFVGWNPPIIRVAEVDGDTGEVKIKEVRDKNLSLTRPKQAIDLAKSVRAMRLGEDVETYVPEYYDGLDYDVPDLYKMSKLERLQWMSENAETIRQTRRNLEENTRRLSEDLIEKQAKAKAKTDKSEKKPDEASTDDK